jgi:hypothetical protein
MTQIKDPVMNAENPALREGGGEVYRLRAAISDIYHLAHQEHDAITAGMARPPTPQRRLSRGRDNTRVDRLSGKETQ